MKKTILVFIAILLTIPSANAGRATEYDNARIKSCVVIYLDSAGYLGQQVNNPMCGKTWKLLNRYFTKFPEKLENYILNK